MLKRIARSVTPGPIRRYLQKRKLQQQIASFQRRVVEHRYGDITLKVELADPLAAGWYDHDWEPLPELALLGQQGLRPGARVFDIGSHQGVVGLMLAQRIGPTGQAVLVEPNPHNVSMCIRNAELNGVNWITTLQAAISNQDGTIAFNNGLNGQAGELSEYAGVTQVAALTLDSLSIKYGLPDVVFIDVEGFECRVLAGGATTFSANPDWFVEVHLGHGLEAAGGSVEEVLSHFPKNAFEIFVHSEGNAEAVPLQSSPPEMLKNRFFLTALSRNKSGAGKT